MSDRRSSPHDGKPRLTVLIPADTFAPDVNGSATFSQSLAAGLAARGHDVHVAAPSATNAKVGPQTEEFLGQQIIVHRIYSWRWYPHPWLRYALPWRIKQNAKAIVDRVQPDVIHFQSHIVTGRGFSLEAVRRGIRLIGTNHFMPENLADYTAILPKALLNRATRAAWAAADRSYSRAAHCTTPTRRAAEYLEANTSVDNVLAISCGLNVDRYTADFGPKTANTIVFLGRIAEEKQIDKLIRAVAVLDPSLDARLEVVGGGDQIDKLKSLARQLGLSDRVHFAGMVDDATLRSSLTRAKVFAMPSIAELQSISTMEAMASGLPVVAADAMALPHLVHDGENGYLFRPGDVDDLADKLTRVLTASPDDYRAMQDESLRIVQGHDIETTLDRFESLYRGEVVDADVDEVHRSDHSAPPPPGTSEVRVVGERTPRTNDAADESRREASA